MNSHRLEKRLVDLSMEIDFSNHQIGAMTGKPARVRLPIVKGLIAKIEALKAEACKVLNEITRFGLWDINNKIVKGWNLRKIVCPGEEILIQFQANEDYQVTEFKVIYPPRLCYTMNKNASFSQENSPTKALAQ